MKVNTDAILLGSWVDINKAKNALDIGTGTGVIALMVAQRFYKLKIDAVEIDENSSLEANLNFQNCKFPNKPHCILSSLQDFSLTKSNCYDHVFSNPPFFTTGTGSANLKKNQARHSVSLSHEELIKAAFSLSNNKGKFSVVLPITEGEKFIEIAHFIQFYLFKKTIVYSRKGAPAERLLLTFSKEIKDLEVNELLIYKNYKGNKYFNEFIDLTKDFYLDL